MARQYMKLYIGDYLRDTQDMDTVDHGAYLLLMMAYWGNGGPLPDDDRVLARIARLSLKRWTKRRQKVAKKFTIENGKWSHKRIDFELAQAEEVTKNRRYSANKRWSTTIDVDASASANALRTVRNSDASAYITIAIEDSSLRSESFPPTVPPENPMEANHAELARPEARPAGTADLPRAVRGTRRGKAVSGYTQIADVTRRILEDEAARAGGRELEGGSGGAGGGDAVPIPEGDE